MRGNNGRRIRGSEVKKAVGNERKYKEFGEIMGGKIGEVRENEEMGCRESVGK